MKKHFQEFLLTFTAGHNTAVGGKYIHPQEVSSGLLPINLSFIMALL